MPFWRSKYRFLPEAHSDLRLRVRLNLRALDLLLAAVGVLYVGTVVRAGWTGDDAFITLRAVDNFVHGHGLVTNPPERVLGFTNPLWAFALMLPYACGLSGYATAIVSSLLASAAAAGVVLTRATPNRAAAVVAGVWLALSASYIDYSTSGLENPLAHLLLALFFCAYFARRLEPARVACWLLAALVGLNRQDHLLLVGPALVSLLFEPDTRRARALRPLVRVALLGTLPLSSWLAFALVYYGFPFPNTAYAKLNLQLPPGALSHQALLYFADTWQRDPVTLCVIALALCQLVRDRSREALATALGLALYLGYIVRIGGDFMAGRFFTAPFLVAVVWLSARSLGRFSPRALLPLAGCSLALLYVFPVSLRAPRREDCNIGPTGIVSERPCYADFTALPDNFGTGKYMQHGRYRRGEKLRAGGRRVLASTNVGMMGYVAGPLVHIIDLMALTDPLLARIPYRAGRDFRIGHFQRALPSGYLESVKSGVNQLADPCLHAYYDLLARVIYGPLFTGARFAAMFELNLGLHDRWLEQPCPLSARPSAPGRAR